jgi:dihydrodipicolinate synthase/N-acetylneuraminate lyase
MKPTLKGIIAAIATATDGAGERDFARSIALARFLLDNGFAALDHPEPSPPFRRQWPV